MAFLSLNASEFVEMFVGVGASRVRDLFAQVLHDCCQSMCLSCMVALHSSSRFWSVPCLKRLYTEAHCAAPESPPGTCYGCDAGSKPGPGDHLHR